MNLDQTVATLRSLGSEQTRKTYKRHGVKGDLFGVSYAELGKLKKSIKTDHVLAEALWESRNHDARILATMIADPAKLSAGRLSQWSTDLEDHVLAGALAGIAAKTSAAESSLPKWLKSKNEWIVVFGWDVLAHLAMSDNGFADDYFEEHLRTIESEIHNAPNMARYAMNGALIAIGLRNPALQKKAIAVADRIGKVEVDHGDTSCKTPDAVTYIRKAAGRRKK
jgi:3-methyladenine DNA glycosylase AlkD